MDIILCLSYIISTQIKEESKCFIHQVIVLRGDLIIHQKRNDRRRVIGHLVSLFSKSPSVCWRWSVFYSQVRWWFYVFVGLADDIYLFVNERAYPSVAFIIPTLFSSLFHSGSYFTFIILPFVRQFNNINLFIVANVTFQIVIYEIKRSSKGSLLTQKTSICRRSLGE